MKRVLFIIAAILMLSWILGVFVWNAGVFIHALFITSVIFCMQAIIVTPRSSSVEKTKTA